MIKLSMLLNIIICNQVFYQGMKKVSLQKTFQSSMSLLNALFGFMRSQRRNPVLSLKAPTVGCGLALLMVNRGLFALVR